MTGFTPEAKTELLRLLLSNGDLYLGLADGDPRVGGTEIPVARQKLNLNDAGPGGTSSASSIRWTLPAASIDHFFLSDSAEEGTLWYVGPITDANGKPTTLVVAEGGEYLIPAGQFSFVIEGEAA